MKERHKDILSAVLLLALASFAYLYVVPNYIEKMEGHALMCLSPAFFPLLAIAIIALLSALLLAKTLFMAREVEEEPWLSRKEELQVYIAFCTATFFIFMLKYFSFLISTPVLLAILFFAQGIRNPLKIGVISLIVTASVYLFFEKIMKVVLPQGNLFQ